MKKIIFLVALFLVANNVSSQSKEETESWIISQIYKYKIPESDQKYYIENGKLYFVWFGNHIRSIEIKNIKNINLSFSEEKKAIFLSLYCNNSKCCKYDYISKGDSKYNNTSYEDALALTLHDTEDSNLMQRLSKAFKHLVALYGGKATSSVKISKEPF